jgi:hypothetical protein
MYRPFTIISRVYVAVRCLCAFNGTAVVEDFVLLTDRGDIFLLQYIKTVLEEELLLLEECLLVQRGV